MSNRNFFRQKFHEHDKLATRYSVGFTSCYCIMIYLALKFSHITFITHIYNSLNSLHLLPSAMWLLPGKLGNLVKLWRCCEPSVWAETVVPRPAHALYDAGSVGYWDNESRFRDTGRGRVYCWAGGWELGTCCRTRALTLFTRWAHLCVHALSRQVRFEFL